MNLQCMFVCAFFGHKWVIFQRGTLIGNKEERTQLVYCKTCHTPKTGEEARRIIAGKD